MEVWKNIPNLDLYQVSNLGRIISLKYNKKKILKGHIDKDGYRTVHLRHAGKSLTLRIHRLVLNSFGSSAVALEQCSHLNGKPWDNRLSNLRWETPKENNRRKIDHGTDNKGERHGNCKLTNRLVKKIRSEYKYMINGYKKLAKKYKVDDETIRQIILKKTWTHL